MVLINIIASSPSCFLQIESIFYTKLIQSTTNVSRENPLLVMYIMSSGINGPHGQRNFCRETEKKGGKVPLPFPWNTPDGLSSLSSYTWHPSPYMKLNHRYHKTVRVVWWESQIKLTFTFLWVDTADEALI